uniref:Apple domain-containing protein n=1 Tax=Panagrellus redivivus TaxID=6233 RepID=A0A7E4VS17_PANRE
MMCGIMLQTYVISRKEGKIPADRAGLSRKQGAKVDDYSTAIFEILKKGSLISDLLKEKQWRASVRFLNFSHLLAAAGRNKTTRTKDIVNAVVMPRSDVNRLMARFFVAFGIISFILNIHGAHARSLYLRCFQRVLRRSMDNAQPITELFYVSPYQCLDQCIMITNNAKQDGFCRSFVYNHLSHSCRLYSHDGTQVPAIVHPANGYDYYRRTSITGECAGPLQRFKDARANAHLPLVGAGPTQQKQNRLQKIQPVADKGVASVSKNRKVDSKVEQQFTVDKARVIEQSVKGPAGPAKGFAEYLDIDDDYSDFNASAIKKNLLASKQRKRVHGSVGHRQDDASQGANLAGFQKTTQNRFETRPGSTGGLPGGSGQAVHLPNNPSELGYETSEQTQPSGPRTPFEVRPGSTGGLPGGSDRVFPVPNNARELGYADRVTPPYPIRGNTEAWSTRLPPATAAPQLRTTTWPQPHRTKAPPPRIETEPEPDFFFTDPPTTAAPRTTVRTTTAPPRSSERKCMTSTGYYVVIGNEIILPVSGSESNAQVYVGVEQAKCAEYCSSGKGPGGEILECASINYFPIAQKCEIYNILAEPHGPGNLVENDDAIYAEKFCLPVHRSNCQEDEIFILHVQKRVTSKAIKTTSSNSITSCLQACLNHNGCQAASFDSNKRRCHMHATNIGDDPSAAEDTDGGWVLIENGCTSRRRKQRVHGVAKVEPASKVDLKSALSDLSHEWSEWSNCRFKIAGKQVRVRTRQCKERCADGGLQIERC